MPRHYNVPLIDPRKLDSEFKTQLRKSRLHSETHQGKVTASHTSEIRRNPRGTETAFKPSSVQSHSNSSAVNSSRRPDISSVPRSNDSERSGSHLRSASVDRRTVDMGSLGSKLCGRQKSEEQDDNPVKDSERPKWSNSENTSEQTHSSFKASSNVTSSGGRMSRSSNRASNSDRIRSASQGLRNLGNTCYMNSTLQCLANIPWPRETDINDDFLNEFLSLMKEMKKRDSDVPINPAKFKKQISVLGFRFSTSDQNDAHEFLVCLLGHLKKSLNEGKKGNIIEEVFLGKQENIIEFDQCVHNVTNIQSFFTVSLPLVTNSCSRNSNSSCAVNLTDCLEHYLKKEKVEGEAWCLQCEKMQSATIETKFKSLPDILILHLKRYKLETMTKLNNQVTFPVHNLNIKENDVTVSYDLFGVCNHFGSLRFGHYTADIKTETGNWYSYSDSSVSPLHDFSSSSSSSSSAAYIFFYKRRPQ